jgi:protein subunit release factor A
MFQKLEAIEKQYEDLSRRMSDPGAMQDKARYLADAKVYSELERTVEAWREFKGIEKEILETEKFLKGADPDLRQLASEERCSPRSCSGCTPATWSGRGGGWRSWTSASRSWGG